MGDSRELKVHESRNAMACSSSSLTEAQTNTLRRTKLFEQWSDQDFHTFKLQLKKKTIPKYANLCQEGMHVHTFYCILKGTVELNSLGNPRQNTILRENDYLGESMLAGDSGGHSKFTYSFTAIAREETEVLVCNSAAVAKPHIAAVLGRTGTSEFAYSHEIARILYDSPLFAAMRLPFLLKLAPLFIFEEVETGVNLIEENEFVASFSILLSGSVIVTKRANLSNGTKAEVELAVVSSDSPTPYFGESSITHALGNNNNAADETTTDDEGRQLNSTSVSTKFSHAMRDDTVHMVTLNARSRRSKEMGKSTRPKGAVSSATVRTLERCTLLSLPREHAVAFVELLPSFLASLEERRQTLNQNNRRQLDFLSSDYGGTSRKGEGEDRFSLKSLDSSVSLTFLQLGMRLPPGCVSDSRWENIARQFLSKKNS